MCPYILVNTEKPVLNNSYASDSNSILVNWQPYPFDYWNGDMLNYVLYWKKMMDGESLSLKNGSFDCNITGYRSVNMSHGLSTMIAPLATSFNISGLDQYYNYSIVLKVYNEMGMMGQKCSQILAATKESSKF